MNERQKLLSSTETLFTNASAPARFGSWVIVCHRLPTPDIQLYNIPGYFLKRKRSVLALKQQL